MSTEALEEALAEMQDNLADVDKEIKKTEAEMSALQFTLADLKDARKDILNTMKELSHFLSCHVPEAPPEEED